MAKNVKRGSFKYQVSQRMQSMGCFGESRHTAKEEYKEMVGHDRTHNKTVGIHSHSTYNTYKASVNQFTKWAKEEGIRLRNIEDVKEEHIKDYIKHREEAGYSAYTYSKDMSALNKVFNCDVTKKDCGVANRSYKDITNNREMKEHHSKINYDNYKQEITVGIATGMRRESYTKVCANSFNYDKDGYPVAIRLKDERSIGGDNLKEKGGRPREAVIPYNMRAELKEVIENKLEENGGDRDAKFFESIPDRLGTHRFRQDYADNMYKQYVEEHGAGTMVNKDSGKTEFRGYDYAGLKYVTENLGHNRVDVAYYNYLGK